MLPRGSWRGSDLEESLNVLSERLLLRLRGLDKQRSDDNKNSDSLQAGHKRGKVARASRLCASRVASGGTRYFSESSRRIALFNRMPASRFSSGKFSLGECARQLGSASPRRSVSTPRTLRKSVVIGMLPPSRIKAGSRSNALRNARWAAWP
jgi:hypothetical protein